MYTNGRRAGPSTTRVANGAHRVECEWWQPTSVDTRARTNAHVVRSSVVLMWFKLTLVGSPYI